MAVVRFSRRAEADLLSVGEYTLRTWGAAQADRYLSEIEACCRGLAESPLLGRTCDEIRPDLRRMEHGRHVVFYRKQSGGILVSRILHQSMMPKRHTIDDTP